MSLFTLLGAPNPQCGEVMFKSLLLLSTLLQILEARDYISKNTEEKRKESLCIETFHSGITQLFILVATSQQASIVHAGHTQSLVTTLHL